MLRCYVVVVLPLPNVDNNFASASAWALKISIYCLIDNSVSNGWIQFKYVFI